METYTNACNAGVELLTRLEALGHSVISVESPSNNEVVLEVRNFEQNTRAARLSVCRQWAAGGYYPHSDPSMSLRVRLRATKTMCFVEVTKSISPLYSSKRKVMDIDAIMAVIAEQMAKHREHLDAYYEGMGNGSKCLFDSPLPDFSVGGMGNRLVTVRMPDQRSNVSLDLTYDEGKNRMLVRNLTINLAEFTPMTDILPTLEPMLAALGR